MEKKHDVCPWWMGYLLACPLRRFFEDPAKILATYVREGMTVLEPGPGMGFFTLELARRVGDAEPGRGRELQFPIEVLRLDVSRRFGQEDGTSRLERTGKFLEETSRVGQFVDHGEGEGEVHLAGEIGEPHSVRRN